MKKQIAMVLCAFLLTGCASETVYEIVSDEWVQPVSAEVRQILLTLPAEAASPALEEDGGAVYICDQFEVYQQILPSGDLSATVRTVSGFDAENLTVLKTMQADAKRYDFVWACAADSGDRIGKGCILDDGNYHYVLTVLGDASAAAECSGIWQEIFNSFALS